MKSTKPLNVFYLFTIFIFSTCQQQAKSPLPAFEVFCEMVANNAKPIALSQPMEAAAVDKWWKDFEKVAEKYGVELYKEENLPVSMLFPADVAQGKMVIIIYKGQRLVQYEQWKEDLEKANNDKKEKEALARRFGRLLGYSPQGINQLLTKNSDYRTLASFGVGQQITHLYYKDLEVAITFYSEKLGLQKMNDSTFYISEDAFIQLHPLSETHPEGQAKSTAIALLTDQLPQWYEYVQAQNIPIKYTYKPKEGGPHDGFVAIDPEGYLLEFEQFKQHPENELFMAVLSKSNPIDTKVNALNFYASITWTYHKDMLKMQAFYEEVLGYQLVADQGWTKIYQTSSTGFIGLVDECRGMEDYADAKAVELEWKVKNRTDLDNYAQQNWADYEYNEGRMKGPELYFYSIQ